jgi:hypothetical protein
MFDAEVQRGCWNESFNRRCLADGKLVLGVKTSRRMASIFNSPATSWPADLAMRYERLKTPKARIRFYIKMLRTRANGDGTIRELKEAK